MSIDILMPALSPTMETGTLAKWLVKKGDRVTSGDVIAEIETDKASMEVEVAEDGVIADLLIPEGSEDVKINTPIARLSADVAEPPAEPVAAASKQELHALSLAPTAAAASPSAAPLAIVELQPAVRAQDVGASPPAFASPLARRMAEQTGLDLAAIKGTGPHGRVVKIDVDARRAPAAARAPTSPPSNVPPQPVSEERRAPPTLEQFGIASSSYRLVPLDGIRRTVARRLTDSFRDVPHFPLTMDVELDALLTARASINAKLEASGVKVSVNDMVIKAAAVALRSVPEANASYTPDGVAMHRHADIAVAVALEGGLITPILRAAETKGLRQIATEAKELVERARARKLKPEEYQGGTFSISNLGMFGIRSFSSIVNEPHGCILSVGAGEKRPVVRGDELAIATVMTVTLTCDHRVVDGAIGARWLTIFKGLIEDPLSMI